MALLRSPRTDYPFQLSFVLSRYCQCRAACPHATQHSRSEPFVKLCARHYTRRVAPGLDGMNEASGDFRDSSGVWVGPPIAWALAVVAGLALEWLYTFGF